MGLKAGFRNDEKHCEVRHCEHGEDAIVCAFRHEKIEMAKLMLDKFTEKNIKM